MGIEQRRDTRVGPFNGEYSCRLVSKDSQTIVPIRPLDVSRRGLGFLVKEKLEQGGFFYLEVGAEQTQRIRVELAYCQTHLGIDNLFRGGLFLREEEGDLTVICEQNGLLLT